MNKIFICVLGVLIHQLSANAISLSINGKQVEASDMANGTARKFCDNLYSLPSECTLVLCGDTGQLEPTSSKNTIALESSETSVVPAGKNVTLVHCQ